MEWLAALAFPAIDPVAVAIGPFAIRWYALAYIAGLVLGWTYVKRLARRGVSSLDEATIDDLLVWVALGVILGGRLGYVLFYWPGYYLPNPHEILMVWRGGMAFHGGLLGVAVVTVWFARRRALSPLVVADTVVAAIPIGLFFGRIANFINGELWGRTSNVPWAIHFPGAGLFPRHPSQLYEAALEGLVLFVLLTWLVHCRGALAKPGMLTGAFLAGYSLARGFVEFFRQPDEHIGFLLGPVTMGQLLCLPMLIVGVWLILRTRRA
ncbi:MAG TPA: prolipoprotein diacylglyceryl transferase [Alphaproteobacteria bacterium]|nr:prolipoprotein diacylglyceryl transferase [Alphaproteobacteria bacterium]